MDTITRAEMAVVLAEEGGIGVIDRWISSGRYSPQVKEITAVKRTQHGIISDPHTILPTQNLSQALAKMESTGVGTLVGVDEKHRLIGLLTERDARFVSSETLVSERMTPRESLLVHTGPISLAEAEKLMRERKIKKLPLIDVPGKLLGLITAKDLLNHKRHPFATRDDQGRLCVAAAVGATGDYLERADELLGTPVQVLAADPR
jgi:IMP dehydrogenase